MTSVQGIMEQIQEARGEEALLSEELSGIDQKIRDDREDFRDQRMGIAEGRSERPVREVIREERAHIKDLQERREELPYEIHAARGRVLDLEVARYEQQEKESEERYKAASEKYEPIKKQLEALKAEHDEAEGAVWRELSNIERSQNAAVRKREELRDHLDAGPQRLPEHISAETRI